MKRYVTKGEEI